MFLHYTQKFKWLIALEVFILLNAVPALAYYGLIPGSTRYPVALALVALMTVKIFKESWSLKSLGLKGSWSKESLEDHFVWAVFGVVTILTFWSVFSLNNEVVAFSFKTVFFSLFLSFLQELIFRNYLIEKLEEHKFKTFNIYVITATTFTVMHLFFDVYLWALIPMCFVYGIITCWLYMKHRNLILLTLNHWAINLFVAHLKLAEADPLIRGWLQG